MTIDDFPEDAPARPVWLMTLADLALLLVGFFVFLQASQNLDRAALARGIRQGFGAQTDPVGEAMPVAAAAMNGFAPGSASLPGAPEGLVIWSRDAARDPRMTITITGSVDGSLADVDPATGSGTVLAANRASAIAAAVARAGAVPATRLTIATAPATLHNQRGVLITSRFTGERP